MSFKKKGESDYKDIRDKLDQEKHLHRGFGYREFDLFQHPDVRVPVTVQARLMNVGSTNTIYGWIEKRKQMLTKA